ncbi:MAG TPA: alpha/beta hydrolase [Acidimicrobiales bacterium]
MSTAPSLPHGLHFVSSTPVPGLAVAERRVTNPEATLICIHGGLDRGGSFARLARRCERFDVVTYDRRGYQGSRALQPLDLEHHVSDLLALARQERARGPVILFGHSFGGVVALAASVAELALTSLVLVYEAPLPWILRRDGSRPPLSSDPEAEAERFFRRIVSDAAWERMSELERQSRRLDGPALLSDLRTLRDGVVPFDIARLEVPTTFIYGDGLAPEFYRNLNDKLALLNPLIEGRDLVNAGHGAHLSVPDQLAQLIEERWDALCALA